jgi:hypothetical protein
VKSNISTQHDPTGGICVSSPVPDVDMEKTMNTELISQYSHIWRVFERLVNDFDDISWVCAGRKATTPARLSFHILKATKYYMEDTSAIEFASGKSFDINCETANEEALPSRSDVIICIKKFAKKLKAG